MNPLLNSILCGLFIGSSMLIPGLSGGTMAIILGIYDKLIKAVSNLTSRKNILQSLKFLSSFMVGALVGIYLFSGFILSVVQNHKQLMLFFFIGIILATIPTLYKKTGAKKLKISDILLSLCGLAICVGVVLCKDGLIVMTQTPSIKNFIVIVLSGFVISIALILPGISCSQMLLLLGVYEITLDAVKDKNLFFLLPLSLSIICGILLFTSLLNKQMKNHTRGTYFIIIGFVIASIFDILPNIPKNVNIALCVLTLTIGFVMMNVFSRVLRKLYK